MNVSRIIGAAAWMLILTGATSACSDSMDRPVSAVSPENFGTGPGGGADLGAGGAGGGAPQAESAATFTPAEVTNILVVLNQGEVDQAQIAVASATSPEVKAFAQQMINEHSQATARSDALRQRLEVPIAPDPTSTLLAREGRLITQDLQTQTGPAFDLAYMTAQISAHSKMLGLIDVSLFPSATQAASTNAPGTTDVVNEVSSQRAAVVQHDVAALRLQQTVRTSAATGTGIRSVAP